MQGQVISSMFVYQLFFSERQFGFTDEDRPERPNRLERLGPAAA